MDVAGSPTAGDSARYNSFQRLYLSFFSPIEVFDDIARKPTIWVVLVASVLLGLAIQLIALPHVDMEATLQERLEASGREIPEEQMDAVRQQAEVFKYAGPIAVIVVYPLIMLAIGALYFLGLKLVGSDTDYKRTLSGILHAYWPPGVVTGLLFAVLVQRVGQVSQDKLQYIVKSNAAAFLSADAPAWLTSLTSSIDLFNVWTIALLVVGLSAIGKVSRAKSAIVVIALWAFWIALKTVGTAVMS